MTFKSEFRQFSGAKWLVAALLETFFRSVPTLNVHGETKVWRRSAAVIHLARNRREA